MLLWCRVSRQKFSESCRYRNSPVRTYSQKEPTIKKKVIHDLSKIRNIGIIAHVDAGKTTTCERMLYYTNSTRRVGDVDKGDTVMDYMDLERQRGITITAAAISFKWGGHTINVIDTPGHVDFTVEVERSVRVLDGAVTILDAVAGVQAQTETVWNQATRYGVPQVVYINKMDRDGASFNGCISSLESRLYTKTFPIQLPIGSQRNFGGVVDLISMETIEWSSEDFGFDMYRSPVSGVLEIRAKEARAKLIEQAAECDDKLMAICLSEVGLNVSAEDLKQALRRITLAMKGVVVMCGSSLKNKGVQPILDSVIDYLPSPLEKPPVEGQDKSGNTLKITPDDNSQLCALAFKVIHDHKKGMIVYFRVYSGKIQKAGKVINTTVGIEERPMRLFRVRADDYEDIEEVRAGDIAAATGLKHTRTGDTIIGLKEREIILKGIKLPEPVFFCSVVPESPSQEENLNNALKSLQLEDPSFNVSSNKETGQLLISGMGELHLEIIKDRLTKHYKAKADTGTIYIAYRSSVQVTTRDTIRKTYSTNSGKQENTCLTLEISCNSENCNQFKINEKVNLSALTSNKKVASDLAEALSEGAKDAFTNGVPSGFPFHNLKVELIGIEYDQGTSVHTYRNAMIKAILQIAKNSSPVILEPIMETKIQVDSAHLGNVLSDLTSRRRGAVEQLSQERHLKHIKAFVPLKELLGYSSDLRSATKGTGFYSIEFSGYAAPPNRIQEQILKEHGYF